MFTIKKPLNTDTICILLIGNNPLEMSSLMENISQESQFQIEIAFDIKGILNRLIRFRPTCILIDDNLGKETLETIFHFLSSNPRTKNIPIAIIKNSNYQESLLSSQIFDFLLKKSLTPSTLVSAIKNSIRLNQTRNYLRESLNARRGFLSRLVNT